MNAIESIFGRDKVAIAMVHVRALPGTPGYAEDLDAIARTAANEAEVLVGAGFDAILIENMHDAPYLVGDQIGPEIVAGMTRVGVAVREAVGELPIGVQVLAAGNRQALAVAQAIEARFVRVENFAYAHVADEGLMARASAGDLLRYRKAIGCEDIRVFADIKKKHAAHSITGDLAIGEMARGAAFCGADGIIVTGGSTGNPASHADIQEASAAGDCDVLVGSGVTPDNVGTMLEHSDGVIVGSSLKLAGRWDLELDPAACRSLMVGVRTQRGD